MDAVSLFALRFGLANATETDERGNTVARGSIHNVSIWMDVYEFYELVPTNYRLVEEWGDSMYRLVWCDDFRREILTYAEGDLILVTSPDDMAYIEEVQRAAEFYDRHSA